MWLQVNLIKVGEDGDTSNYIENSEWTLVKLHAQRNVEYYSCCAEPYPDVTYTIQMKRKPLFYVFNMILPCFLITLVALLGFYIPNDSGEKVSMGITTLLSMTVFLMLVAENMPPTSDVLPLIGEIYSITTGYVNITFFILYFEESVSMLQSFSFEGCKMTSVYLFLDNDLAVHVLNYFIIFRTKLSVFNYYSIV